MHIAGCTTKILSCHSAREYFEWGYELFALKREEKAFHAFTRSLECDPLDLDVYEQVSRLYAGKGNYQQSLAFYEQALRLFPACARLHEKRAEVE
ncbi:hypothetical protein KSF_100720 [Reticulibacter mediterranei]|uniref:Tetratricopeptide repeat protein n=1 Tax=Reticulibacter mediterranei TaxID=2778369 RepID=A0A8J3IY22_9CHLR|nr:hypothetical protein KSF_100720 [Reticulibacter mediterranei]